VPVTGPHADGSSSESPQTPITSRGYASEQLSNVVDGLNC
jgi:hypothetical protein